MMMSKGEVISRLSQISFDDSPKMREAKEGAVILIREMEQDLDFYRWHKGNKLPDDWEGMIVVKYKEGGYGLTDVKHASKDIEGWKRFKEAWWCI